MANLDKTLEELVEALDKAALLTTKKRNSLKDSDFAVPGKRKLPIHDCNHARNAAARLPLTKGLTPEERKTAKSKIQRALAKCRGK